MMASGTRMSVKPLIMHRFINYFDYILHIIASNLRYFHIFFQVRHCFNKEEKTSRWGSGFTCLGRRRSKNDNYEDIVWARISRVGEGLEVLREKKFKEERKKETLVTNPNHTPPLLPIYIIINITIMMLTSIHLHHNTTHP